MISCSLEFSNPKTLPASYVRIRVLGLMYCIWQQMMCVDYCIFVPVMEINFVSMEHVTFPSYITHPHRSLLARYWQKLHLIR
jgi:hypothetical protein